MHLSADSKLGKVGWPFRGLHGMFSFMYKIKPPPNRLRSSLKTLKLKIGNWFIGNVPSIVFPLVSGGKEVD